MMSTTTYTITIITIIYLKSTLKTAIYTQNAIYTLLQYKHVLKFCIIVLFF